MRARNREINIFNMSLLDILTGMLGAFLFLMLGMLPYYSKVVKNKEINPEEMKVLREKAALQEKQIADLQKQLEDLQNTLAKSGGGPLTAEQVQDLMNQLSQLRQQLQEVQNNAQQQNQQAQQQIQEARQQAQQMQQQLDETIKDRDFWRSQQGTLSIITRWGSADVDIDVLVMGPDGDVYTPKVKDNVLGKPTIYDGSDSHSVSYRYSQEGLLVYLSKSGDYLVFYRVPSNAIPSSYAALEGNFMYNETQGKGKGVSLLESGLGPSNAQFARPGGYYAWTVLTYDANNYSVTSKSLNNYKLPKGIMLPQQSTSSPSGSGSIPGVQ